MNRPLVEAYNQYAAMQGIGGFISAAKKVPTLEGLRRDRAAKVSQIEMYEKELAAIDDAIAKSEESPKMTALLDALKRVGVL